MNTLDQYTRRVLIAALYLAAWWLRDVFILLLGALILATGLRARAQGMSRIVPLPDQGALAVEVV